ncbi:hypothetical protein PSACC_02573 [Paramicrosporidium saccamoebae]|uniref:Nicotinamide phosphoribosyltransferase n=1 Tax=Paramicrosporidium saccamoebae TaxID=1246581 RepID=A0A2H9TIR6_9FUNG|nr:hypothetical protein PSACC_02573 [Paramicrosporidium saccamoebae]
MIPIGVLTDSYKASHPFLYPPAKERVAYGEFRCSFERDLTDQRILFYGMRYIVEKYLERRWTQSDLEDSCSFFSTHNVGYGAYPFPRELFQRIIDEHDGWFPIKVTGLSEGEVIYPHTPVYTVTATEEFAGLVTWMETLLTMVWYPTTVATLSRRIRDLIEVAFHQSVELEMHYLLDSRLHDFGFRGCTCVEQAIIGGTAHLLSFTGTDTAAAAAHVQFHLNEGRPVGQSIPATEHSVMTAFGSEREAILQTMEQFGDGAFACVMDSYDYANALEVVLPTVIESFKLKSGGFMVLRPDSGDSLQAVLDALVAADRVFGSDVNSLGFKVLRGCGVVQGDGIDYNQIQRIIEGVLSSGYSAQNVVFGMGSNLLHKIHRDTMSFATKLSFVRDADGASRDVCKTPKTDVQKFSLPGLFSVKKNAIGVPMVHPLGQEPEGPELLQVYYDHGPVTLKRSFDDIRKTAMANWERLPKVADPISPALKEKIKLATANRH